MRSYNKVMLGGVARRFASTMAADCSASTGDIKFLYTLCRHGQTQANKDGIIQGQLDVPLSEVGEEQASLLGKRLSTETFTHIYASDLSRAKSTAEAVCKSSVGEPVTVTTDTRIRERNFGNFEGRPLSEFRDKMKGTNLPLYLCAPDSVETIEVFMDRTVSFFKEVCSTVTKSTQTTPHSVPIKSSLLTNQQGSEPPIAHVLVAAHGGVVRMHLMYFESLRFYIPGSTTRATPNTAITSFLVTLDKEGNLRDALCLCLHDNSHTRS